jgi:formylglycine-generating enzyme required for sulfatase activity
VDEGPARVGTPSATPGLAAGARSELRWTGSATEARCTTTDRTRQASGGEPRAREVPLLDALVELPAGRYEVGEPGRERGVALGRVLVGRWPVVNAHVKAFTATTGRRTAGPLAAKLDAPQLADHPVTDVTRADAEAFCVWVSERLGRPVRLPSADEWEALARGTDARPWPWGEVFDESRCACAESGWGWTVPVTTHPAGAGPFGAEQLAGNVWEWVADSTPDGWGIVRGGSYLDTAWGLRACRSQPADPTRATCTTGFRIAIEPEPDDGRIP